jgi:hypothetical protein
MSTHAPGSQALYQQLLTCLRGDWHSLAVVPAAPQLSAAIVANALVDVSNLVRGQQARLFSTEGLEMAGVAKVIVEVTHHVDAGGLAVVTVDSVVGKQTGIPLALATDAALLVVHLGVTRIDDAKRTVELIGEKKFIGAVTIESASA